MFKYIWLVVPVVIFFIMMGAIMFVGMQSDKNIIKYDCRQLIGGWHPDIPTQVMEECRKRSGRI